MRGVRTQKNTGAAHSEGGVRGKGRGDLCVFNFIAYLLSLSPSPSSSLLSSIYLTKYHNENKTKTPFPSTFHFSFLFFFLIFSRRGEPLPGFPFWCFVAGPVVKLRLRRPRELGDRALWMAKELDVPPSCLAKEILC